MRTHLYDRRDLQIGHETNQQKKMFKQIGEKHTHTHNTFHETNPFDSYTTSIPIEYCKLFHSFFLHSQNILMKQLQRLLSVSV